MYRRYKERGFVKQFIYISLVCGIISGAGIFYNYHYPSMMIPRFVAILGIISAITIRDKEISGMLKLGGIMINIMPLLGSVIAK